VLRAAWASSQPNAKHRGNATACLARDGSQGGAETGAAAKSIAAGGTTSAAALAADALTRFSFDRRIPRIALGFRRTARDHGAIVHNAVRARVRAPSIRNPFPLRRAARPWDNGDHEASPEEECRMNATAEPIAEAKDELEGMMSAQLIAGHAAAMTCYRAAATADSLDERHDCLNQAVRLSRAFVTLVNALQRRRVLRGSLREHFRMTESAEGARHPEEPAEGGPRRTASKGAPPTAAAESVKQSSEATGAHATVHANSAKQPSAGGASACALTESAKPPLSLAPDLPDPTAHAARAAAAPDAESAKQPSAAAGRSLARSQPSAGEGAPAAVPWLACPEPAADVIGFAKQPRGPIGSAPLPLQLARTYATVAHRAALIARLMEGPRLRIAE
jgi:hypothetical protein